MKKLFTIFRFHFIYQLRRPITWVFFIALIFFSYKNTGDDQVADTLYEDFFINSPFSIAQTTVIGTFIWLIMAATIAGNAAARDITTGIYPLTYSTPITKSQYIGGQFLSAFILNALMLIAVQLGIIIAIYSPTTDPEAIGPFGLAPFITAYTFISLPNAFFATAIQFWLASRSGRPTTSYFASFLLFFMGFFVAALLLYYQDLGTLVDPIGIRYIIEDVAHDWTPTERRDRLIMLEGTVLTNRLVWISVGIIALAITYLQFQFSNRSQNKKPGWWRRKRDLKKEISGTYPVNSAIDIPNVSRRFGLITYIKQMLTIASRSFSATWFNRIGISMLLIIPLLTFIVLINKIDAGGVPRIPTTALVLENLTASLNDVLSPWSFIPFLILIIAGEIVWRERDAKMSDLMDVLPTSEWSLLLGKLLSVTFMIVVLMILLAIGGVITQLKLGYNNFEPALYLKIMFGLQLPEYLLFAFLIVIIHVIANNKYIGHMMSIVASVLIVMPSIFEIEHNLLIYDAGPKWSYTDMRGFGASLGPWLWFKLYWAAWALLLAVVARLLWTRGSAAEFNVRLRVMRDRFTRTAILVTSLAGFLVLTIGGFIFYNTNILNIYLTKSEYNEILAEYEKRYSRYQYVAQPRLVATNLKVEIYPGRGAASIAGKYHLVNQGTTPIDSVHLAIIPGAETNNISFDRAFDAATIDDNHGHRIYRLHEALQPGDSLQLGFDVNVERGGFGNNGVYESVVANGTFFTNSDWLPSIGYQSMREMKSAGDRREHGLPQKRLIPSIDDERAPMAPVERTMLDVVIGTNEDQVAVTTGAMQKTWTDGGRRYFHYSTDKPIGNEFVFFSAKYAIHEIKWKSVNVSIYYHPTHKAVLDRMTKSIIASLEHYTNQFGPYPHSYLTYAEVRGNEIGMHADESMIRFSEGTALWNPGNFDLPFSVVAHELAHQWWGHQLEAAFVEGAPVLSESLAVFSSMMVVNESLGPNQLQRVLSFMREPFPYAPIQRGEPLLRGIDPYISYRKGPFALNALAGHIGSERVEEAMKHLLESHPRGSLPLSTTKDLYSELQAATPDSLKTLLHDLWEVNTLWQFRIERATAKLNADSIWQVKMDVRSRKVVIDEAGVETELPMDEWIDVVVFAPGSNGRLSNPVYANKQHITSENQTITVAVKQKPVLAGIDPYHVLDWEEREDDENVRRVKIAL